MITFSSHALYILRLNVEATIFVNSVLSNLALSDMLYIPLSKLLKLNKVKVNLDLSKV